jgi:hypothetical protein
MKFMLLSKFSDFISRQKIQLASSYLEERNGESIKPILESIRPSDSKEYLDSTVDGDGRRSVIWTSYDPESGWADVWSLGCIVYELCALRSPFKDEFKKMSLYDLFQKIITGDYSPLSSSRYSSELLYIIDQMLIVNPDERATINDVVNYCTK